MSEKRTSSLMIRDVSYKVREMSGKDMRGLRILLASEKEKVRSEAWLVSACTLTPTMTEAEANELPQFTLAKLQNEILRLTNGGDDGEEAAKND